MTTVTSTLNLEVLAQLEISLKELEAARPWLTTSGVNHDVVKQLAALNVELCYGPEKIGLFFDDGSRVAAEGSLSKLLTAIKESQEIPVFMQHSLISDITTYAKNIDPNIQFNTLINNKSVTIEYIDTVVGTMFGVTVNVKPEENWILAGLDAIVAITKHALGKTVDGVEYTTIGNSSELLCSIFNSALAKVSE